jgi:hypothetical protein
VLGILRHLRILHVKPGDVLVYRPPDKLTQEATEALQGQFARALPEGTRVLIVPPGATLGTIRQDA